MGYIDKKAMRIAFGDEPIIHVGGPVYEAPSESSAGDRYVVNLDRVTCECPYWRKRHTRCKHIAAARLSRTQSTKGEVPLEPVPNVFPNPPWYDQLKSREERSVRELLRCLGALEPYPKLKGRRRPPACIGDLVVLATMQAYGNKASRC